MLSAHAAPSSPSLQREHVSPRPGLPSPPLSVSPSELEIQLSPASVKEKRRKQVPASSRGGLGNIRARKQSKLDIKDTPCHSPSSFSSRLSTSTLSTSRIRRVLSVGSNSMSSASSEYSTVDSVAATDGSGAASMTSGSSGVGEDYAAFSDSGSPLSVTFASPESGRTKGKAKSKVIISASAEYALHLQTDIRQRALEKHLARARAKEGSRSLGQEIDRENDKAARSRMGRGGAGVYKAIQTDVDPSLHPHAATITQEYEARAAAQEREIISASRMRSALKGSTGRGGAGNVGFGGKAVEIRAKKEKKKKDVKGKGRACADAHDAGESGEGCTTEALEDGEAEDDATIAIGDPSEGLDKHRKKRPGFRRLLQRVIRPHADIDSTLRETELGLDESTPRPSMDGSILEIGQPSTRSHWDLSSSSSSLMSPQPSRVSRRLSRSKEKAREGAELLAFVNAALPDLRSAQNVLGVPGTPGFPRPSGRSASNANAGSLTNQSAPSSGSSTPLNGRTPARTDDNDVFQEVECRPFQSGRMEEITEEEWVDDETLQEDAEGEHSFVKEDDEDEDSDIDPQLVASAYNKQGQFVLPEYDVGNRHNSLDTAMRVALDKLDRIEITDQVDDPPTYDEAGIIDAYTSTGDGNDGSRDRANLHSAPISAPLILQPAPRYLRASAPALPAQFYTGSRGAPATRVGVQSGKLRAAIPVASPPPTRPVPRIPSRN